MILQVFFCFRLYNFLFCFMYKIKSGKDTRYKLPLVGVSPKLASGSLLLVGVKAPPTVVCPPLLLLLLLLPLLHGMESFGGVTLPCLGCVDVLV